jgi:hypothetical protein
VSEFFDFVYLARKAATQMDWGREFIAISDSGSLDAPENLPGGSTVALGDIHGSFHCTRHAYREGFRK